MAQGHDYNKPISGVTKSKDLYAAIRNNVDATRSCHSGLEAPLQPVDGMLWLDRTLNKMKVYNAGTSQWDLLSTLL
jgi:hypothetical protein